MKPTFVREIEKHTGLKCREKDSVREWEVLAPSGIVLFSVMSFTDDIIGGITQPDMFEVQGISKEER